MKPTIKGRLHTDEKQMKVGKEDCFDVNTIDSKTKFVIEGEFMKSRTSEIICSYFKRIKDKVYAQILERYQQEKNKSYKKRKLITFVSDEFDNYRSGAVMHFYRTCKIVSGVPIACKKYKLEHNNNPIERYNQDIENRYKTTRHWGSFESASLTLRMRQIIHNFVNPHMELNGKTPAEAAGIILDLGRNKLLGLIELAYMPKT